MVQGQYDDNPYSAPSEVSGDTRRDDPRFRVFAVFIGWLSDIVFSTVVGVILGVIGVAMLAGRGVPLPKLQDALNELTWFLPASVLVGACGTIVGAYVAAVMGKVMPIRHALAVGVMSLLTSVAAIAFFPDLQPMWVTVAGVLLVLPAALLGGFLRAQRVANKA